jgi:hypothetical protein
VRKGTALAALAAAGAAVAWWRARGGVRERADLYFEDGSMVSFRDGDEEAGELLALAREVLAAART